jgi:hypothetical protein
MMRHGDVLIRSLPGDQFLVVNAVTLKTLKGPFTTFAEAVASALLLVARGGTIWRDYVDDRGRPLGPPIRVKWPCMLCVTPVRIGRSGTRLVMREQLTEERRRHLIQRLQNLRDYYDAEANNRPPRLPHDLPDQPLAREFAEALEMAIRKLTEQP